jgi:hypothetical protein
MATAFQRNAFQNNAFQIEPLPVGNVPGSGGWGAGIFEPTWVKPLSKKKGYRPEPESRRKRELAALEAALQAAWEKLYPLPAVEAAAPAIVPEIALPEIPRIDWNAVGQQHFDNTKAQIEAATQALDKIIAERAALMRDEDDIEAILMLMS